MFVHILTIHRIGEGNESDTVHIGHSTADAAARWVAEENATREEQNAEARAAGEPVGSEWFQPLIAWEATDPIEDLWAVVADEFEVFYHLREL